MCPAVLVVDIEGDFRDANDGKTTLCEAVDVANLVQQGQTRITFAENMQGKTIKLRDVLGLEKNIVIDGLGKNITITRDDNLPDFRLMRVWDGANSISTLIGLTLQGGRARDQEKGGAIFSNGAALTLQDCVIRDNKAPTGGGIAVIGGTLDIVNCTIRDNEATDDIAGGIFLGLSFTTANITNTSILFNTASTRGGGIGLWGPSSNGVVTLHGVSVLGNIADDKGAGIYVGESTNPQLKLTNGTLISANTLTDPNSKGGGVYLSHGSVWLNGVSFVGNTANTGTGLYMATGTGWFLGPGGYSFTNDTWVIE